MDDASEFVDVTLTAINRDNFKVAMRVAWEWPRESLPQWLHGNMRSITQELGSSEIDFAVHFN